MNSKLTNHMGLLSYQLYTNVEGISLILAWYTHYTTYSVQLQTIPFIKHVNNDSTHDLTAARQSAAISGVAIIQFQDPHGAQNVARTTSRVMRHGCQTALYTRGTCTYTRGACTRGFFTRWQVANKNEVLTGD
jgi:hypothetical protein